MTFDSSDQCDEALKWMGDPSPVIRVKGCNLAATLKDRMPFLVQPLGELINTDPDQGVRVAAHVVKAMLG